MYAMKNSIDRFTKTVADYVKYRPTYPQAIVQVLAEECGLTPARIIADIGAGTGILSKLFLDAGNQVYGVEPNPEMRSACEIYLEKYINFYSVKGTAEATTLANQSVDLISVGTAFHWFNMNKVKLEFQRILRPNGWVVLLWNVRDVENSLFLQEYENLILQFGTDYRQSRAKKFNTATLVEFFYPHEMHTKVFKNVQHFDLEGLIGRLLSTSYSLRAGDENYDAMLDQLKIIFNKYQQNGKVEFPYLTKLYYGHI